MKLPFDRKKLAARGDLDRIEEAEEAKTRTPEDRIRSFLELTDLCIRLARASGVDTTSLDRERWLEKARAEGGAVRALVR